MGPGRCPKALACDENQQAATGKECEARGKEPGIWVLARACTSQQMPVRRLAPLTHALIPRVHGSAGKGLAGVQSLIGSLCAEHNPTPVTDGSHPPT